MLWVLVQSLPSLLEAVRPDMSQRLWGLVSNTETFLKLVLL